MAALSAGCGSEADTGIAGNAVIEGKGWNVPRSLGWTRTYANRVTLSSSTTSVTIPLESANQCQLQQFGLSAAWRHAADPFGNFSPLRVTLSIGQTVDPAAAYGPPVVGSRYAFGEDGFLGFDGLGHRARGAGACEAEVVGYYNEAAIGHAGIALSFAGCRLTSTTGDTRIMDGEVFCETGSFTPIDLPIDPPTIDAGVETGDGGNIDAAESNDAGDADDSGDASDASEADAEPDGGDASDAGDPCMATCVATEVCVAGACAPRAQQTQSQSSSGFCGDATRVCDPGEDSDCAPEHACVAGLCRRLSCQTQSQSSSGCSDAYRPCDDDDNSDCAPEHACVAGLCRRLSCQTQSQSSSGCSDPYRPCDGDDNSDCAPEHACVAGLCRRLSCQTQSQSSVGCSDAYRPCDGDDDADCAADHACAGGLCRRLSCQVQAQYSSGCAAANRVCDIGDDSDCAPDHECSAAGFCHRDGCPAPL